MWDAISIEEYVNKNSDCRLLSTSGSGILTTIRLLCGCGFEFETKFKYFKRRKYKRCNKCSECQKITIDEVREFIDNNTNCVLLSTEYKSKQKIKSKCSCGRVFEALFDSYLYHNRQLCNECESRNKAMLRANIDDIKDNIKEKTNNECSFSDLYFKDNDGYTLYVDIICKCGAISSFRYRDYKSSRMYCEGCINEVLGYRNKLTDGLVYIDKDDYMLGIDEYGNEFKFDKDDYESIAPFRWTLSKDGYITRYIKHGRESLSTHTLHREVMGLYTNEGFMIDHINRDKTDNRKCNLRFAESWQNNVNKGLRVNNTSSIIGVSYNKKRDMWTSELCHKYKTVLSQEFESKEGAIVSRLKAEVEYLGQYAPQKDLIKQYLNIEL